MEKIIDILWWFALPTVKITEHCKKKWIRVMGYLCALLLWPLGIFGIFAIILSILIGIWEEI